MEPHTPSPGHPHSSTKPQPDTAAPAPLPIESDCACPTRAIVFFGGSFDPPHRAHIHLASLARDLTAGPDAWLVFVPAARSPFKATSPTPAHDRLAMLELAIGPLRRTVIWPDELDRAKADPTDSAKPSYWIDTLVRAQSVLKARFDPLPRLRFILGSDQAVAFDGWHRARDILALAEPIVIPRPPLETPESFSQAMGSTGAWNSQELARWNSWIVPTPIEPTSATEIRSLLGKIHARQNPAAQSATQPHAATSPSCARTQLAAMLGPKVLDYIIEHNLYRTQPD